MVQVGQTVLDCYINELTKNNVEWNWGSWQQEAFDKLKDCVTSEPVLVHLELDKQFELEVATSGYAVGAILLQRKADGKKHPIAYYSSTLNTAEQNYDICELEYLAIHWAMMQWWHILAGSPHKIIIHLDHQNLMYWKDPQKLSWWIARECLDLMEFDFEIHHIPCYVIGEHLAQLEQGGYNFDTLHIVLEACTSDTQWEQWVHGCKGGTGLQGHLRYPRRTRWFRGDLYVLSDFARLTQELRPKV